MVLFHLFYELFGELFPSFRSSWVYFGLNGGLAVTVFFVLSGDALSAGFLRGCRVRSIDRLVVKRYMRLALPILFSCVVSYLLMVLGLTFKTGPRRSSFIVTIWLGCVLTCLPRT